VFVGTVTVMGKCTCSIPVKYPTYPRPSYIAHIYILYTCLEDIHSL
jgi:hypothetical protein